MASVRFRFHRVELAVDDALFGFGFELVRHIAAHIDKAFESRMLQHLELGAVSLRREQVERTSTCALRPTWRTSAKARTPFPVWRSSRSRI